MRTALPLAALLAVACLEYSPHEVRLDADQRDLHEKAVAALQARPAPSPLRFAVLGDTQRRFGDAEDAVDALNARDDLAFVIQVGDLTHWGLAHEFEVMNRILAGLRVPYFVVVGIHDLLGTGPVLYREMYGPRNFAFTYARTRFVLLDTNSREYGYDGRVPDLAWLAEQLAPEAGHDVAVVVSHVPPDNLDFDQALRPDYLRLLRDAGAPLSLHGHSHAYRVRQEDGVLVVVADDVAGRSFLVVTRSEDGQLSHARERF